MAMDICKDGDLKPPCARAQSCSQCQCFWYADRASCVSVCAHWFCPAWEHYRKEPGSICFAASLQVLTQRDKIPPEPPLGQTQLPAFCTIIIFVSLYEMLSIQCIHFSFALGSPVLGLSTPGVAAPLLGRAEETPPSTCRQHVVNTASVIAAGQNASKTHFLSLHQFPIHSLFSSWVLLTMILHTEVKWFSNCLWVLWVKNTSTCEWVVALSCFHTIQNKVWVIHSKKKLY